VPPGLKVSRATAAVEMVMAEEAALMVEAMADVELETTIATADADNIRQQTTINNRLGAQLCLAVATTEVSSFIMAVVTKAATALAATTHRRRWWQRRGR
jgi:hypothetical protein